MSILQNAANVLRCFGTGCVDLTVTGISERLDLPKASASRLLRAMQEAGMLETIAGTRRYRPGRTMLDLAAAFRRSSGIIGLASAAVFRVSREFGHTGYVSILDGREVTAVADFEGTNALRVVSTIGRRHAAHQTATGRTLLARLSVEQLAALYPEVDAPPALRRELAAVRSQGYALSHQEAAAGVDGIAVAVADPMTEEAVSLCIVYPHSPVSEKERDAMIAALARGAAQIADAVGDEAFQPPKLINKVLT
ncbi:IclR family transcriptional regulator [Mangrovibrevibacter kandeliae]|uniref:IclR family transcriptional regulator n=1 Tax=Mangrovibrevibacter kandeliae TaxID=2968473 RepID=UPI002117BF44|nr:IclR family transcriptional regulator [Aurantimonas sp. CSK15Z-1]MCQ8781582.1 IclR family transcriptional regulator [Aurantimonas sp. CSK15Z-1]